MWEKFLVGFLDSLLRHGQLELRVPSGRVCKFGGKTGETIRVSISHSSAVRALVLNPELALGETYMKGSLTIENDDLDGLLDLLISNMSRVPHNWRRRPQLRLRTLLRRMSQFNTRFRSRRNVAHHYDLSDQLYDQFLDAERQYSCAYFRDPADSLDVAQKQKMEHIARKLLLEPGMRVLDIGCGWGGLALYLARRFRVHVTGITLSEEQYLYAKKRAVAEGLEHLVTFRFCDYREIDGEFDRLVSVGMFEHVGLPHYDRFFAAVRDRLADDGIAVLHTIGWTAEPSATNPWIAKYIFPGGYIPALSETMASIEKARLWAADVECLRLHYAYTLSRWRRQFEANISEVRALYDEEFIRMWRFYLSASEHTFRHNRQAVFQFQLSKTVDAVPLTRDYLYGEQPSSTRLSAAE